MTNPHHHAVNTTPSLPLDSDTNHPLPIIHPTALTCIDNVISWLTSVKTLPGGFGAGNTAQLDAFQFPVQAGPASFILVIGPKMTSEVSRQDQEALLEDDKRFRLLVSQIRDCAIFILDTAGRVVTWNLGADRIKGYRPDEIIGRHFSLQS